MAKSTGFLNAHSLGRLIVEKNNVKGDGICAFGLVSGRKGDQDYRLKAACHASLAGRMPLSEKPTFMVDHIYPFGKGMTNAQAKRYAKYILMQSPYSPMFAEKNIEKGWKRKYFLYNVDIDSNMLVGGAVALRMLSETPKIPVMWNALVEAGADPDMALLLAHMSAFIGDEFYVNNYSDDSHKAISPTCFNASSVKNFLTGEHKKYGKYDVKMRYMGFNGMWRETESNIGKPHGFGTTIYNQWMQVVRAVKQEGNKQKYLFDHSAQAAAEEVTGRLDRKVAMPIIAKILNDYRGELNV